MLRMKILVILVDLSLFLIRSWFQALTVWKWQANSQTERNMSNYYPVEMIYSRGVDSIKHHLLWNTYSKIFKNNIANCKSTFHCDTTPLTWGRSACRTKLEWVRRFHKTAFCIKRLSWNPLKCLLLHLQRQQHFYPFRDLKIRKVLSLASR